MPPERCLHRLGFSEQLRRSDFSAKREQSDTLGTIPSTNACVGYPDHIRLEAANMEKLVVRERDDAISHVTNH